MTTNRQRLMQALELLQEAKATLNRKKHNCEHCGMMVRENWTEDQAGEVLKGALSKLAHLIDRPGLQPWLDLPQA